MFCCPHCFSDSFLKKRIIAISKERGTCSFCKKSNIPLIPPNELFDYFQPLVDLYEKDKNGKPINDLIQQDWNVISLNTPELQISLLASITEDHDIEKSRYKSGLIHDKASIEQWETFREELKHQNRFFPKKVPDKEQLVQLLQYTELLSDINLDKFFRARLNTDKPISIKKMRKPPAKIVTNGRANPIGIPYLYLASTIETAISEIRGHKGEIVTVAEFTTKSKTKLSLADLRNPKETISPFKLGGGDDLPLLYKYMPYLTMLGEELSKPITPREANLEYLPSQYLCEIIKHMRFHGIIYKSSIANGDNYVIFADNKLKIIKTEQYKITDIFIESEKLH